MVDFTKLLNRSPAERQADIDRAQREFDERQDLLLAKRKRDLDAAFGLMGLNARELDFLNDLRSRATQHDVAGGRDGGKLLYISDDQVRWLERLAARAALAVPSSSSAPSAATSPASEIYARMTRRRITPIEEPGTDDPVPRR